MIEANSSRWVPRGGALDALRFLAAAFIVVFHAGDQAPIPLRSLHEFFDRGYLATDFFLMLSGFVLAGAYGPAILAGRLTLGQFLAKRLVRNYPAHLITLTCLVIMVSVSAAIGHKLTHPEQYAWSAIPAHLLLIHGWGFAPDTWNAPTWSISALLACYAAFPLLWRQLQRLPRADICLTLALVLLLGSDLLAKGLFGESEFSLPFRWALVRAFPLFVVGLLMARLIQVGDFGLTASRVLSLGAVLVFTANVAASGPDVVSIVAILAVIAGCGSGVGGRRWPAAEWAAKISFSLFITHSVSAALYTGIPVRLLQQLHPGVLGEWAIWAGGMAFALAVAAGFHHFVDEPIQRRLRARLFSPRPVLRPAPAQSA